MSFKDTFKGKLNHWAIIAGAVLIAFLIRFVPMWLQRDAARTQLRKSEISNLLPSAIVDARRGETESARQQTSEFFKRLTAEADKNRDGFLTADQRTRIKIIFVDRDEVITTLAQRDPASIDRLSASYVAYQPSLSDVQPVNKQ